MTKFTIFETATKLNVNPMTIRRWIKAGKILAKKENGEWQINGSEITRLLTRGNENDKLLYVMEKLNQDPEFSASQTLKVIEIFAGLI